tara:strand:- start:3248 stop:5200 length:1953 start_codon:yes stop_codon:yes gene_type:complete
MLSLFSTALTVLCPSLGTPLAPATAPNQDQQITTVVSERSAHGHSSLHPSTPTLFLEIPDIPGLVAGYEQSAYGRALANPEFHAALEKVLGQELPDGRLPLMSWMDALAAQDDELADIFALMSGLEAGSISIAMPDQPPMELIMTLELMSGDESVESMGLQVMLDYSTPDLAADALESMWLLMGGEDGFLVPVDDAAEPGGIGLESLMRGASNDAFEASLRLFRTGNRIVLLGGNNTVEGFVARAEGLASPDPLAAGRGHFGPASGVTAMEFHNGLDDALLQVLTSEIGPVVLPIADLVEGMAGPLLTMILRGGDWRIQLADGRFVTDGMHAVPTNPFSRIFASAPLPEGALDTVPADAALAWVAHFDADAAQAWIVDTLTDGHPEGMGQIEAEYGFRPDRDLIAPLGDSITWSMGSSISVLSAPPLLGSIPLHDAATFRAGLENLMAVLGKAGQGTFELSERAYRKQPIYTLRFLTDGGGSSGFGFNPAAVLSPSIVALDDRVIITLNSQHARRAVRAAMSDSEPKAPHQGLHGLALPEGSTEVAYADWMGILGQTYDGVRKSILPLIGGNLGDAVPIDFDALPDSDLFAGFWNPSFRWKRTTDQGTLHHAESSFGPEGLMLPSALVFLFLGVSTTVEAEAVPVEVDGD